MANVEKPCMSVGEGESWLKPFDQFGENWKIGPNGQIDDADLERWRSLYMLQDARPSQVDIPSSPSSALCPYFRADMYRRQFNETIVKPELKRKTPLSDAERIKKREETLELLYSLQDKIKVESDAVAPRTDYFFRAMKYRMENNAKSILDSLQWKTSKLCGIGMGVEKEVGSPARIDLIVAVSAAVGLVEPKKTLVMAVDGEDVTPFSLGSLIKRIRGPQGSMVTLSLVSLDSREVSNITFNREDLCATSVDN